MASASLIPLISYSDSCLSLHLTKGRCRIGYGSGKVSPFPDLSLLSFQQRNHTGCLRATQQPTIVCAGFSKSAAVTSKSWDKLVLKNESTVLVEFYASWCGPCQMVHRVIDDIANEYRGKLDCFVLNTDNDMGMADVYDIKAVPVVLLFKNGKKHDCIAGTMPKEYYVAAIEKVLAS